MSDVHDMQSSKKRLATLALLWLPLLGVTGCLRVGSDIKAQSPSPSCAGDMVCAGGEMVPSAGVDGVGGAEITITGGASGGAEATGGAEVAGVMISGTMAAGDFAMSGTMVAGEEMTSGAIAAGDLMTSGAVAAGEGVVSGGEDAPPEIICDRTGVDFDAESARGNGLNLTYTGVIGERGERVVMTILNQTNGPRSPGRYSLDGISLRDCELCLSAYSNCEGDTCKTLYGAEGEVELIEVGMWGRTQLHARLNNVVFREYTELTAQGEEVPNGLTWCLPDLTINLSVAGPVNGPCESDSMACLGESVSDYGLTSCESGRPVSAHDLMNTRGFGVWMALSTVWSDPIFADRSERLQLSNQGIHAIYVLGEGEPGEPPTISQCDEFSAEHGIPLSILYLDYTDEGPFRNTFSRLWSYHDHEDVLELPVHLMVRSGAHNYEYVYARGADRGDLNEGLNLLANP